MSDPEIEIVAEYPYGRSIEEQRRAFVFAQLANAEIDEGFLLAKCVLFDKWIETGEAPKANSKLKAVK